MPAASVLLRNAPHRPPPEVGLGAGAALRLGRLHEACGDARRTLALMIAGRLAVTPDRPVVWITPDWMRDRLHGDGIASFLSPGLMILVAPTRAEDVLWVMEEVLRTGTAPLAVADLPGLPSLTAVRRMHLAAETGMAEGRVSPLGLILTEGAGGAPGVESRWRLDARHMVHPTDTGVRGQEAEGWRLDRLRARTAPPRGWTLRSGARGVELHPDRTGAA